VFDLSQTASPFSPFGQVRVVRFMSQGFLTTAPPFLPCRRLLIYLFHPSTGLGSRFWPWLPNEHPPDTHQRTCLLCCQLFGCGVAYPRYLSPVFLRYDQRTAIPPLIVRNPPRSYASVFFFRVAVFVKGQNGCLFSLFGLLFQLISCSRSCFFLVEPVWLPARCFRRSVPPADGELFRC